MSVHWLWGGRRAQALPIGSTAVGKTACDAPPTDTDTVSEATTEADTADTADTLDTVDTAATDVEGEPVPDGARVDVPSAPQVLVALDSFSSVEKELRAAAGLEPSQQLHPVPQFFPRLAEAIECLQMLVVRGSYGPRQLGVFSAEISGEGSRRFFVDTYPGCAVSGAPAHHAGGLRPESLPPRCLYEVILEGRPSWLYFDLEFSRAAHPGKDPSGTLAAFYATLDAFCLRTFGEVLERASVLELDASNADKFSKHVVCKWLRPPGGPGAGGGGDSAAAPPRARSLAFRNNAQVGLFVERFMGYAQACRSDPDSPASHLFTGEPQVAPGTGEGRPPQGAASIVDASVYTRNRCFRLLFSTKFGKRRPFVPSCAALRQCGAPAQQLLQSMATFVPEGVPLVHHASIPEDLDHNSISAACRPPRACAARPGCQRQPAHGAAPDGLTQYLVATWDSVRSEFDGAAPAAGAGHTSAQNHIRVAEEVLVVSLQHNRFCFCKGASHRSNGVYLVVDMCRGVFYQKCHDIDCRDFRSREFTVPAHLLEQQASGPAVQEESQPPSSGGRRRSSAGAADLGPLHAVFSTPWCVPSRKRSHASLVAGEGGEFVGSPQVGTAP